MTTTDDDRWVPEACTLPTVERPLRLAEFDDLFATTLRGQRRVSATTLRWELDPAAEGTQQPGASGPADDEVQGMHDDMDRGRGTATRNALLLTTMQNSGLAGARHEFHRQHQLR